MSQSGSESDIWEYRPLSKTRKSPAKRSRATKRRKMGASVMDPNANETGPPQDGSPEPAAGHCPLCQMPFSILMVQSRRWHVAECVESPGDDSNECPDGLRCSSSIPSHYKKYSHFLLAHSRATTQDGGPRLSRQTASPAARSSLDVASPSPQSSQDGLSNALLLLRSPALGDIKKKKGWSPSAKGPRSQESKVRADAGDEGAVRSLGRLSQGSVHSGEEPVPFQAERCDRVSQTGGVKKEPELSGDDENISYSPLSELPADVDSCTRRTLFRDEGEGDQTDDDDALFTELLDQCDAEDSNDFKDRPLVKTSFGTCVASNTSFTQQSQIIGPGSTGPAVEPQLQSQQSLILERLREQISNPDLCRCSGEADPSSSFSQTSSQTHTMGPRKTLAKAAPTSGFKQTDIGVFFGLKPLKEKGVDGQAKGSLKKPPGEGGPGENTGHLGSRRTRRRKEEEEEQVATTQAQAPVSGDNPNQDGRARQGGETGGWRRRNMAKWNKGAPQETRYCPFHKKIPGTTFAVDAFQYGTIKDVTAYFLTHFHSDHYGGLTKASTLPIYCNRITGNLVESKLKVDERYIHVLPMDTEVTVDGVKVIVLDANHCPGAAMFLFTLPNGQRVLHTGDFRADPSMERYPALQGVRVHTLYLDTTYCSPEYTFPTQGEVITFAANTAFEMVTLNPRTLVVCGTYSVGKEKVFLAVAAVLASKVCLSRDKFNTMCCLESAHIRQSITTDWKAAQVHVLPMMQLNFRSLQTHLKKFSGQYDQLVAFKPTGWTFAAARGVEDVQKRGNISIYGVPYSEHSSYLEMKRFVQWLRPDKVIATVGNRQALERHCNAWVSEAGGSRF
ncbi:DNA cross-link repair 1A protein [Denticeps clupeoides]|uniref:DNA cross-link repair 1A protein n=1 Tax=Denticeps clupeoides TaxID=299321 RepID=A0AAY4DBP2_9TELE|nr:DNA cross-link repair 1A protein [Denticeps clupeoides]